MDSLVYEISEELIEELCISESADLLALNSKIKNAYREVKRIRSYPDEYSDEMIEKDMERYYSNIRNLALYDYNQIGAGKVLIMITLELGHGFSEARTLKELLLYAQWFEKGIGDPIISRQQG